MQLTKSPALTTMTADSFRALARRSLHPDPPGLPACGHEPHGRPSAFDLNSELSGDLEFDPAERPAAVLVPVVARAEIALLFTQRTDHLPAHAGQIAFPGGKVEESDLSPVATALREAQEEIGLDPALVEPLGYLDTYRTGTGYRITPVVALVDPGFSLALNRDEVRDAFEVPLKFLMDEGNHHTHIRMIGGRERRFYAMPYGERFIWGATAGILRNMHQRLFRS